MILRRAAATALILTTGLTLAGCGGDKNVAHIPPAPSSSASPTTAAASPRESAINDAKAALMKYYQVTGKLYADPNGSLNVLQTVAVGRGLGTIASDIQDYVSQGWHVVGQPSHQVIEVGKVSLDNSSPAKGMVPSVTLITCTDPTKVKTVDKTGKQIPATLKRFKKKFIMANYNFASDPHHGWRAANIMDAPGSC